jgi:hypothetical protein
VIVIIAALAALLLPALSAAKKRALRSSIDSVGAAPSTVTPQPVGRVAPANSPH